MQTRTRPELMLNDLELWTLDDAEVWNMAERSPVSEVPIEDDLLLDSDFWLEDENCGTLSTRGLGRLGIRI